MFGKKKQEPVEEIPPAQQPISQTDFDHLMFYVLNNQSLMMISASEGIVLEFLNDMLEEKVITNENYNTYRDKALVIFSDQAAFMTYFKKSTLNVGKRK